MRRFLEESRDTLIQFFCLSLSGLRQAESSANRNAKNQNQRALLIGIGVVNGQRTRRAEEL
jgi:hypothetical protein